MRWQGRRQSSNVEDLRGFRVKRGGGIGVIILGLIAIYFGVDPGVVMNIGSQLGVGGSRVEQTYYQPSAAEKQLAAMVGRAHSDFVPQLPAPAR